MLLSKIKIGVGLLFVSLALSSCDGSSNPPSTANTQKKPAVSSTGVVVFRDRDGGFFGILNDTGSLQYVPSSGLPANFRKDGLHVRFHGLLAGAQNSAHNWGTPVELTSVEVVK